MAERQTKGFYQDIESSETFKVGEDKKTDANLLNPSAQKAVPNGFVMNIGMESKSNNQKIFLARKAAQSRFTGNYILDSFTKLNDYMIDHSKIKLKDIAVTYRLLATMINAGMPLIKSLNTLAVQSEKIPKLQRVLFDLAQQIETGSSFSQSMEKYPEVFSPAQIGAIQAGEASGQLNKTLKNLATEMEKSAAIVGKVKGALVYPVVILCIMFIVIFLMMVLVIPQISQLFTDSGQELPAVTQFLINMSNFTVSYWWAIILVVLGLVFGTISWKNSKAGRYYWDLLMLNIPVFGNLVKKSTLSKFAYSFGNLLSSGVPIIKAMEIVAVAVGNEVYRKRFLLTAEDMKSGIPMAENLSSSKLFPSMLVNMIEVGEQTAQLENVTQKVAEFYDEEVSTAVTALTKIMEPLIIVIVGITVGGLVAAIMLPIIQLTNVAGTIG
ncbi:type II secretion system F family protein [Candidatus Peregrinibacteria bacterium]|nr:type II secretion system F family protein [Candidatus Peregrinibacteria bacterium]